MTNTTTTETQPSTEEAANAGPAEETKPTDESPASEESTEETSTEEDPDEGKDSAWLSKELERTRRESAKYRTQLREAQEALTSAKSAEEFEAATKELADKLAETERVLEEERMARVRTDIAREFQLPDGLVSRLAGATEDELRADAKTLAALVKTSAQEEEIDPATLAGGLDGQSPESFDAQAIARAERKRRY